MSNINNLIQHFGVQNQFIHEQGDYAHILGSADKPSKANKFKGLKPKGVIITDTFNDPIFPIPEPKVDTAKLDVNKIQKQFKDYYSKLKLTFLPWHYVIELMGNDYFVLNTRPLDMMFPITTDNAKKMIKKNNVSLNGEAQKFFKERPFDLSASIQIKILGSSVHDVYTKKFYELMGRVCIAPLLRMFRLSTVYGQRVISLNLGRKFDASMLDKYLKN